MYLWENFKNLNCKGVFGTRRSWLMREPEFCKFLNFWDCSFITKSHTPTTLDYFTPTNQSGHDWLCRAGGNHYSPPYTPYLSCSTLTNCSQAMTAISGQVKITIFPHKLPPWTSPPLPISQAMTTSAGQVTITTLPHTPPTWASPPLPTAVRPWPLVQGRWKSLFSTINSLPGPLHPQPASQAMTASAGEKLTPHNYILDSESEQYLLVPLEVSMTFFPSFSGFIWRKVKLLVVAYIQRGVGKKIQLEKSPV